MHVPLYFAGPGLTPGATIPHARLVDVTPTIIDLLSHGERMQEIQDLDGVSLVPQLRAARMER
jgi:arylsulfatase A-like enzyme